MRNAGRHDGRKPIRRTRTSGIAILGAAAFVGIAALSAYLLSGGDLVVKPASGTAQAMALAGSNTSQAD